MSMIKIEKTRWGLLTGRLTEKVLAHGGTTISIIKHNTDDVAVFSVELKNKDREVKETLRVSLTERTLLKAIKALRDQKHLREVSINKNLVIVLVEWNSATPYAVQKYNPETGEYFSGIYIFKSQDQDEIFLETVRENLWQA